jgi:hypothetical protein
MRVGDLSEYDARHDRNRDEAPCIEVTTNWSRRGRGYVGV